MKSLFGTLFVLIIAAAGCATENPDAGTPRLTTVASELEALDKIDELTQVAENEVDGSMPMVCDSGGGHGICCWFSESGSFDCVTW